MVLRECKKNY